MSFDNLKHLGKDSDRLNIWNPSEIIFAEQWEKLNEMHNILETLMSEGGPLEGIGVPQSEEVITAVATVIQWLGTNVGQGFLRECEQTIGRRKNEFRNAQKVDLRLRNLPGGGVLS